MNTLAICGKDLATYFEGTRVISQKHKEHAPSWWDTLEETDSGCGEAD